MPPGGRAVSRTGARRHLGAAACAALTIGLVAGEPTAGGAGTATVIAVSLGKPDEHSVLLSKNSAAPPPAAEPVAVTQSGCAKPATTNVAVDETDYALAVTPGTVPCGTVLFDIANLSETSLHSFAIVVTAGSRAVGDTLAPADAE